MDNPLDYAGKVVLVTGGTRGIGRQIAARFRAAGATVVVCGRRPPGGHDAPAAGPGGAPAVAQEGPGAGTGGAQGPAPGAPGGGPGGSPHFVACDVRDPDQVERLVAGIVDTHGRLDVVVNNAGGAPSVDAASASPRYSEAVIRLNLLGPLFVAQAAHRVMHERPEGGVVLNIASLSGVRPSPGSAAYGAAKAGLMNLTRSLAMEWAPRVRVNAVVVGLVLTEEARSYYGDDESVARVAATVPLGRMGTPADVADACLFLASPLASFVSGAALEVHGGGERPPFLAAAADS